jgi:ribose transport system ATP-binding protein
MMPNSVAELSDVPVLQCVDLYKAFGGVPVLKGVSLALERGTVTALAGENGAGKSTMMKIASGQLKSDQGDVTVRGEHLHAGNPRDAHRLGVAIVPQELASIDDMTVYENLFIGREIRSAGLLNRRAMIKEARDALGVFDVDINPGTLMRRLPVGLRQIVEIVKCTSRGAEILLLDEPSSAIAEREVEGLYRVVRQLRDRGVAMIYTTHKMEEMRALADRAVVLRDGNLVLDQPMSAISDEDIVTAMIGRELEKLFPRIQKHSDQPVLEVEEVQVVGAAHPVSFTVRKGEILGLAGLVGAGRTELIEGIFGVRETTAGNIVVAGQQLKRNTPIASIQNGVALVPEDRKGAGAVLTMNVLDNGTLPRLSAFSLSGWLRQSARTSKVEAAMNSVRLRSRGLRQSVGTLSGGNQQKVVIARWLTGDVKVLLLDEPTRGVDVGARSEIYKIITDLAASGMAVIMASSDMPEILGLSHRAFVMRAGTIAAELDRSDLDHVDVQASIFRFAAGLHSTADTAVGADHVEHHLPTPHDDPNTSDGEK